MINWKTFEYEYKVNSALQGGKWSIKNNCKFVKIISQTKDSIVLKWDSTKSGKFSLIYTLKDNVLEKEIIVDSLF